MDSIPDETEDQLEISPEEELEYLIGDHSIKKGFLNTERLIESFDYINKYDYNLNSPLITDSLELLFSLVKNKIPFLSPPAQIVRLSQILKQMNLVSLKNIGFYHQFWYIKPYNLCRNTKLIEKVIKISLSESHHTLEVPRSFFQTIFRINVDESSLKSPPVEIIRWGELFMETYVLTLCLNADTKEEQEALSGTFSFLCWKQDDDKIYINFPTIGRFMVNGGFVVSLSYECVLSREMLLNLKDMWGARFQVLWVIYLNLEGKFKTDEWRTLNNIFRKGDSVISKLGNKYFDVLKMVEPYCIYLINKKATEVRPLLTCYQPFEDYLKDQLNLNHPTEENEIFFLMTSLSSPWGIVEMFGSYRLWGHPFIEYFEGLSDLEHQVNLTKEIDEEYAKALGSDISRIILHKMFKKHHKWFVDADKIEERHPLKDYVKTDTWPDSTTIENLGDIWWDLPIIPCWEIPSVLEPNLIYSDKSHSMTRKEVIAWIRSNPNRPIPSKRVLETLLTTKAHDIPKFLKEIDEVGMDSNDLIIGLRAKERELKRKGRFFALMSWKLREYFVITEYLLKEHAFIFRIDYGR